MAAEQLVLEGTWEEIAPQLSRFAGRRLKLIVITADELENDGSSQQRPIESVLADLASAVSDDEWKRLPADLSDNLDHYIYGTPRE